MIQDYFPKRIICLTEEPTETLYLLGEEERIIGISGFTVRPPRARKEKPKVSAFTEANIQKILELKPDLVIGFSDIQADIARQLISQGVQVWITNHRSVEEVFQFIVQMGSMVGRTDEAIALVQQFRSLIDKIQTANSHRNIKPKVYFEEWYDPLITGIRWVSEIIEIAGGVDIFPEHRQASLAKDRILADPGEVIRRDPDIILASWCGKMFKKDRLVGRTGWEQIQAVKNDDIHEIDSAIILQPGPASVSEGVKLIAEIINDWSDQK